ncbi:MAG: hypothetical protein JWN89_525 [Parcubacteria group bacterium]|nr:hypothetical protein [Parcubacteria group bacterium]
MGIESSDDLVDNSLKAEEMAIAGDRFRTKAAEKTDKGENPSFFGELADNEEERAGLAHDIQRANLSPEDISQIKAIIKSRSTNLAG